MQSIPGTSDFPEAPRPRPFMRPWPVRFQASRRDAFPRCLLIRGMNPTVTIGHRFAIQPELRSWQGWRVAPSPSPSAASGDGTNVAGCNPLHDLFRPLRAGGDSAARCPYRVPKCSTSDFGLNRAYAENEKPRPCLARAGSEFLVWDSWNSSLRSLLPLTAEPVFAALRRGRQ
jgi:hypothetical protein